MKNIINYVILFVVFALSGSCKSDKPGPAVVPEPKWEIDLVENEPTPSWQPPVSGIYQFSMTAIIRLSDFLEEYADPDDEISAFIGDECRGISTTEEVDGAKVFFLYIRGNSSEMQKVSLKYYSAKNKKTYSCQDLFEFIQNGLYGKISEPAIPPFEESGKYPETMTAVIALTEPLPFENRDKDILAAFVGGECRGSGKPEMVDGKKIYHFEIRGKKDETAPVYFQYYSQQTSGIFKSQQNFPFGDKENKGSADMPFMLSFDPVTE